MARGLTDIAIKNRRPGPVRQEIPDPGQRGLYVVVQPSGTKSFAVRYRFGGKPRKLTLDVGTLKAARLAAAKALDDAAEGRDPNAAKRKTKAAVREAAKEPN